MENITDNHIFSKWSEHEALMNTRATYLSLRDSTEKTVERLYKPEDQAIYFEIMYSRNGRTAIPMMPQQHGCLNKSWTKTNQQIY